MAKQYWKGGNMLYPVPAVMVSCGESLDNANIITVAWTGTICTNPPMLYISIRPERHSYELIKRNGEFVVNLTTKNLVYSTDYCGVKSGRDVNKFTHLKLTPYESKHVKAPSIYESPVNIECKVNKILELGSHHMFIADVVGVTIEDKYLDEKNRFCLDKADLIAYSHGNYFDLGSNLGKFGYSIKKKK